MKTRAYKKHNPISRQEINAVTKVMRSGVLSSFVGEWGKEFYGGSLVKKFEKECQKYFKVKHAIAVNSWTSGLICAVGALDPVLTTENGNRKILYRGGGARKC